MNYEEKIEKAKRAFKNGTKKEAKKAAKIGIKVAKKCVEELNTLSTKVVNLENAIESNEKITIKSIAKIGVLDKKVVTYWKDGTETTSVCDEKDTFDPVIGMSVCITKKVLNNKEYRKLVGDLRREFPMMEEKSTCNCSKPCKECICKKDSKESSRDAIVEWLAKHPNGTTKQCAKDLGISDRTVRRWKSTLR